MTTHTPESLHEALFGSNNLLAQRQQPAAPVVLPAKKGLTFKHLTDEQEAQVEAILGLEVHESWDINTRGYFFIDISGEHRVFYTLWRFMPTKSPYVSPETYICNLSIDPIEAAKKARQMCGIAPIMMDAPGNKEGRQGKPDTLSFGKYRGQHYGDVFAENPGYFAFLNKLIRQGEMQFKPDVEAKIAYYADMHFETITKTNRETVDSSYFGTIGAKMEKPRFTVTHVNKGFDFTTTKMTDEHGNRFITYSLPETTQVGAVLDFESCLIKDHREIVGIKYTVVNYLRAVKAPKAPKAKK